MARPGWSFGGVLAFEMARQLRRLGRTPKGVVLIDSPSPVGHRALPAEIISHIIKQSESGAAGVTETAKRARARIASQFQHHAGLLERYAPEPRSGDVPCIMLRCTQTMDTEALCGVRYPWLSDETVRARFVGEWEGLIGRHVTCYDIACNHFEVFQSRNIGTVSRLLAQACEAIDKMSQ
ncbi:Alpha/Beta hydrolase protein [Xylaria sp. FL0933]|nr:Alpha/Beta hydrolase protein [Xylaria sp. FL0933]